LNGFELAGRAIRVGLGNDKFTNESTQAILDRYNDFRDAIIETVPRGNTERSTGGSGGGGGGGGGHGGGERIARTLDDADDSGVSLQNVSREALMKKLAREEPKEEAPPYDSLKLPRLIYSARKTPQITAPTASRCVLLKNMFNPAEETGSTWVKELEDDVKLECEGKYGKVCPPFFKVVQFIFSRLVISTLKNIQKARYSLNSTVLVPARARFKGWMVGGLVVGRFLRLLSRMQYMQPSSLEYVRCKSGESRTLGRHYSFSRRVIIIVLGLIGLSLLVVVRSFALLVVVSWNHH
jgi:hypothetical protein